MAWLKPEAVSLLRQVQEMIVAAPEQFHMAWWYQEEGQWMAPIDIGAIAEQTAEEKAPAFSCGMSACIAGDLCLLDDPLALATAISEGDWVDFSQLMMEEASRRLGVAVDQGRALFMHQRWPYALCNAYEDALVAEDARGAALVAVQAIDSFIAGLDPFDTSAEVPWGSYDGDDYDYDHDDYDDDHYYYYNEEDGDDEFPF